MIRQDELRQFAAMFLQAMLSSPDPYIAEADEELAIVIALRLQKRLDALECKQEVCEHDYQAWDADEMGTIFRCTKCETTR